uniref:Ig-like domain-containing protein n=1 Tax=Sparus aurata TaxID=8175 RepID=A0A671Z0S2_SPAAU
MSFTPTTTSLDSFINISRTGTWKAEGRFPHQWTPKIIFITLTKGETATMDCNLGTVTGDAAFWYKQVPGGVPQFVLRFRHSWSSPNYGSGFSSPKFTTTHQSQTDYRLIINNVEEGDSAVYHCNTWDDSVKEWVPQ